MHSHDAGALVCLAELELQDGGKHSESVLPGIERVLKSAHLPFSKIDRFITSTGPGSFTGLRIAFSALKAFALATGKPVDLVDGHDARAWAYWAAHGTSPVRVASAITRESFLVSRYDSAVAPFAPVGREVVATLPNDGLLLVERPEQPGTCFPLQARHLAECLLHAKSRRTLANPTDLAAASPNYFGSRNY
jgi:tRNA threonylcarbamoyl adenosine modification protein YeaZ